MSLDALLWRYEYGRAGAAELEVELRHALDRLSDARSRYGEVEVTIRRYDASLLAKRDASLRTAWDALAHRRFRAVLLEVRHCSKTVATIDELVRGDAAVRNAAELHQRIDYLASTVTLRQLPCVASLSQLTTTAQTAMREQQYRRAYELARVIADFARPLLNRNRPPRDADDLSQRIEAIEGVCRATSQWAGPGDEDPESDGSLRVLQRIHDEGWQLLAFRLLTQLEISLGPRWRFARHRERLRRTGELTAEMDERLDMLVRDRGWDGAIELTWEEALASHRRTLIGLSERLASAATNLEAVMS